MSGAAPPNGRFLAIHGHFYQPPRENPWTEEVEVEDGAAPHHDWNERITAECYAPNTASRRVDGEQRITGIANNFEKISFNFGPTLLSWLHSRHPETYANIIEADRISRGERHGHGNAIAQAYNHLIMPLATRRDKVTQVRWGIEDFHHRFGRDPEGLWLPETAVDRETLDVLAEGGIKFTILAPSQCRRVRKLRQGRWVDVTGGRIDPSRAYHYVAAGGGNLALYFYDAPISRAIAFEGALAHGETLAARFQAGFSAERAWPQLVHAATDGESYGHHTTLGDMALAAALERIERKGEAALTNYGTFLAAHPPTHEVEIIESTSWSCAHGVERWRSDCGCRIGHPDWHQLWRAPLREAMDWLRDRLDPFYEARIGALVKDPWAARDDYIHVILDRSEDSRAAFFDRHRRAPLDDANRVEALKLLELQRQRLLMYASDGWFFDEISGLETVQVLKSAARAVELAGSLGLGGLDEEFRRRLAPAPSNYPAFGNGAQVYRRLVLPAAMNPRRVLAHYAIAALQRDTGEESRIFSFAVSRLDAARETAGGTAFMVGRARIQSEITTEAEEASFAVLHLGEEEFRCSIRGSLDHSSYEVVKADLLARYVSGGPAEAIRGMERHFPGGSYSLKDLVLDERRRILSEIAREILERRAGDYRRIWEENRQIIHDLSEAGAPVPDAFVAVARHVLQQEVTRAIEETLKGDGAPARAMELIGEAHSLGLDLDLDATARALGNTLAEMMEALARDERPSSVNALVALLDAAGQMGLHVDLRRAQNFFFDLWRARPDRGDTLRPLGERLGFRLD